MHRYVDMLGAVSPTLSGARRASDIVAALAPPSPTPSAAMVQAAPKKSVTKEVIKWAPGLAGAGVGYFTWHEHPVLGLVIGHALGSTALPFMKGDRRNALAQLGVEAAAVAGALYYRKHPAIGFVGGLAAGIAVASFVPGTNAHDERVKLTQRIKNYSRAA